MQRQRDRDYARSCARRAWRSRCRGPALERGLLPRRRHIELDALAHPQQADAHVHLHPDRDRQIFRGHERVLVFGTMGGQLNPIDTIKRSDFEPYELRRIAFGAILTALRSAIFQLQARRVGHPVLPDRLLLSSVGSVVSDPGLPGRRLGPGHPAHRRRHRLQGTELRPRPRHRRGPSRPHGRTAIRLDPYSIGYLATAFTCFAVAGLKEEWIALNTSPENRYGPGTGSGIRRRRGCLEPDHPSRSLRRARLRSRLALLGPARKAKAPRGHELQPRPGLVRSRSRLAARPSGPSSGRGGHVSASRTATMNGLRRPANTSYYINHYGQWLRYAFACVFECNYANELHTLVVVRPFAWCSSKDLQKGRGLWVDTVSEGGDNKGYVYLDGAELPELAFRRRPQEPDRLHVLRLDLLRLLRLQRLPGEHVLGKSPALLLGQEAEAAHERVQQVAGLQRGLQPLRTERKLDQ